MVDSQLLSSAFVLEDGVILLLSLLRLIFMGVDSIQNLLFN